MSTVREIVRSRTRRSVGRSQGRLESWKEIAVHLRREVRTVQRWARYEGMPVRRLFHRRASSVYAFASELDNWLEARSVATGNSKGVRDSSNAARLFSPNPFIGSGARSRSSRGHARLAALRSAEPVSVEGKEPPRSSHALLEQQRVRGKEERLTQMSFFVACHAFDQLGRSVPINISLNVVLVGTARGATGLLDIPNPQRGSGEGKHRDLPN